MMAARKDHAGTASARVGRKLPPPIGLRPKAQAICSQATAGGRLACHDRVSLTLDSTKTNAEKSS
jgi:hypothetical protein